MHAVLARSPASKAGILAGDFLVDINGESAAAFSLERLYDLLRRPGELTLRLQRGEKTFSTRLSLVPLV